MQGIPPRPGSNNRNRAPILRSPIPPGGFGRPLTKAERAALRALGRRISNRARVLQETHGTPRFGIVYQPAPGANAYIHGGVYVEFAPRA